MPSDESKGSQLDAIGSLAQRQLDNTPLGFEVSAPFAFSDTRSSPISCSSSLWKGHPSEVLGRPRGRASERPEPAQPVDSHGTCRV